MNIWILIASLIGAGIFLWWLGRSQGRRWIRPPIVHPDSIDFIFPPKKELWEYADASAEVQEVFKIHRITDLSIVDGHFSTEMVIQMEHDKSMKVIRVPGGPIEETNLPGLKLEWGWTEKEKGGVWHAWTPAQIDKHLSEASLKFAGLNKLNIEEE